MPAIREHTTAEEEEEEELEEGEGDDMPPLVDNPPPSMTYTFFTDMTPASFEGSSSQPEASTSAFNPFASTSASASTSFQPFNDTPSTPPGESSMQHLPPTPLARTHGKKRDASYIPRPPNAFILFRSSFIKSQQVPGKVEGNHSTLSKIIGMYWRSLSDAERQSWEDKAKLAQIEHRRRYPDWRFRPSANARIKQEEGRIRDMGGGGGMGMGMGPGKADNGDDEPTPKAKMKGKGGTKRKRGGEAAAKEVKGKGRSLARDESDAELDAADDNGEDRNPGDARGASSSSTPALTTSHPSSSSLPVTTTSNVVTTATARGRARTRRSRAATTSSPSVPANCDDKDESKAAEAARVAKIAGLLAAGTSGADLEVALREWEKRGRDDREAAASTARGPSSTPMGRAGTRSRAGRGTKAVDVKGGDAKATATKETPRSMGMRPPPPDAGAHATALLSMGASSSAAAAALRSARGAVVRSPSPPCREMVSLAGAASYRPRSPLRRFTARLTGPGVYPVSSPDPTSSERATRLPTLLPAPPVLASTSFASAGGSGIVSSSDVSASSPNQPVPLSTSTTPLTSIPTLLRASTPTTPGSSSPLVYPSTPSRPTSTTIIPSTNPVPLDTSVTSRASGDAMVVDSPSPRRRRRTGLDGGSPKSEQEYPLQADEKDERRSASITPTQTINGASAPSSVVVPAHSPVPARLHDPIISQLSNGRQVSLHRKPPNPISASALPLISTSTISLKQASTSPSNSPTSSTNSSSSSSLKVPLTSMFKRSLSAPATSERLPYPAASDNAVEVDSGGCQRTLGDNEGFVSSPAAAPTESPGASGASSPWAVSPVVSIAVAQPVQPSQQPATTTQNPQPLLQYTQSTQQQRVPSISHYLNIHQQYRGYEQHQLQSQLTAVRLRPPGIGHARRDTVSFPVNTCHSGSDVAAGASGSSVPPVVHLSPTTSTSIGPDDQSPTASFTPPGFNHEQRMGRVRRDTVSLAVNPSSGYSAANGRLSASPPRLVHPRTSPSTQVGDSFVSSPHPLQPSATYPPLSSQRPGTHGRRDTVSFPVEFHTMAIPSLGQPFEGRQTHARRDTISFPMNTAQYSDAVVQPPPLPPQPTWQQVEDQRRSESQVDSPAGFDSEGKNDVPYWWSPPPPLSAASSADSAMGGMYEQRELQDEAEMGVDCSREARSIELTTEGMGYSETITIASSGTDQFGYMEPVADYDWDTDPGRQGVLTVVQDSYTHEKTQTSEEDRMSISLLSPSSPDHNISYYTPISPIASTNTVPSSTFSTLSGWAGEAPAPSLLLPTLVTAPSSTTFVSSSSNFDPPAQPWYHQPNWSEYTQHQQHHFDHAGPMNADDWDRMEMDAGVSIHPSQPLPSFQGGKMSPFSGHTYQDGQHRFGGRAGDQRMGSPRSTGGR